MKYEEPDKQEADDPREIIAADDAENEAMDEDEENDELAELTDARWTAEDEAEFTSLNSALNNISDALDKLEEQNDQLNEEIRSILEASKRIQSGLDNVESVGHPST